MTVRSIPVMGISLVADLIRDARMAALMGLDEGRNPYIKVDGVAVGHCKLLCELDIYGPTDKIVSFHYD